ncbi:hypothetical protein [Cellvibrio sp. KY-YJ-3]|uniref:hypothetical protein n=1 Tax=Cellvibrio sp. KY-YJ-3 TaxID=454662 RepID=UPI00124785AC|nr:hypothetical protein [Cellvibrio sp. KY-YJ-3]QEY12131.1 hypothetical protein D0B88_07585 [Cellvibrio sp. KY-YJ-3]
MIIVEILSALFAPALEVAAPLFVLAAEATFWLILLIVELIIALVLWRKPRIPGKPRFYGVREKIGSFAVKWREKRKAKSQKRQAEKLITKCSNTVPALRASTRQFVSSAFGESLREVFRN